MNPLLLILLLGGGYLAWRELNGDGSGLSSLLSSGSSMISSGDYSGNANYQQWQQTIQNAAIASGLPQGLLDNLLYVESHYRTDIINGTTTSSSGAQGIAQFMPSTASSLGIDPLDPSQAIPAAAQYLASLYNSLGDWDLAVAAYNWGIGNVQKWVASGESYAPPAETQNYVAKITGQTLVA